MSNPVRRASARRMRDIQGQAADRRKLAPYRPLRPQPSAPPLAKFARAPSRPFGQRPNSLVPRFAQPAIHLSKRAAPLLRFHPAGRILSTLVRVIEAIDSPPLHNGWPLRAGSWRLWGYNPRIAPATAGQWVDGTTLPVGGSWETAPHNYDLGGAVVSPGDPLPFAPTPTVFTNWNRFRWIPGAADLDYYQTVYIKDANAPALPYPPRNPVTEPVPGRAPAYAPMPSAQPAHLPVALAPYRLPDPALELNPNYQAGPRTQPNPAATVSPSPGLAIHRGHALRPPGPGVRERKVKIAMAPGTLNEIIGIAGEANDIVDVFFDNLAPHARRELGKRKSDARFDEKARIVYKHLDTIDVVGLISDLVLMQFEDAAWGKIGRALGKGAENIQRPVGFQFGPAM